jgi:hypothetical protein
VTGRGWRAPLAKADVFVVLVGVHVVVKLLMYPRLHDAPLSGDEIAYADGARALSNLLRDVVTLGPVDTQEIKRNVVGNGWFMPGMSIVLTPLFLVLPDAGVGVIRAFLGAVTTVLAVWAAWVVRRALGAPYAYAVLLLPVAVPMWLIFCYTAWGDLAAGLLIVVAVGRLVEIFQGFQEGRVPTARQGAGLGLLLVATLYLRSSALPLVVGLMVVTVIGLFVFLRSELRRRSVGFVATTVAVFVAVLLPWSVAASKALDDRVVTTSTVPLSMAVAFGDPDRLCFGSCDRGSVFINGVNYSRQVAAVTGRSELEIQQEMSAYAREGVTTREYANAVLDNARRYLAQPNQFERRFREPGRASPDLVSDLVRGVTNVGYFTLLAAGAALMLLVTRQSLQAQLLSVLLKLVAFALLLQPLVHVGTGRYWTSFAPMLAVGAVLLAELALARRPRDPAPLATETAGDGSPVVATAHPTTFLLVVQVLLAVFFVTSVAVLLWLGW